MQPIARFIGAGSTSRLVEALRNQYVVDGNDALATALATVAKITQHAPGARIIEQGAPGHDVYFILLGEVSIVIEGQEIARRQAGQHVGEMSLIDASAPCMATLQARDTIVVAGVSEAHFSAIAERDTQLWRRIAMDLGHRLRERNRFIRPKNETPILLLGSSRESLSIVDAMVAILTPAPFVVRPWTGGVFSASQSTIDDLAKELHACDIAALVLGPGDQVRSRGIASEATRNDVVFELGLFMGVLERTRTLLVVPRDADVKIPLDVLGLNPLRFDSTATDIALGLSGVCQELSQLVRTLGSR